MLKTVPLTYLSTSHVFLLFPAVFVLLKEEGELPVGCWPPPAPPGPPQLVIPTLSGPVIQSISSGNISPAAVQLYHDMRGQFSDGNQH